MKGGICAEAPTTLAPDNKQQRCDARARCCFPCDGAVPADLAGVPLASGEPSDDADSVLLEVFVKP
jgi:hypothetical protein